MRTTIEGSIRVVVGAADYECQIWSLPKENTVSLTPEAVRQRYGRPMSAEQWTNIVEPLSYFRDGVTVTERTVETEREWPIQRVTLQGERAIRGALQARPGLELLSLCLSYDGADRSQTFAEIENSITATITEASQARPSTEPVPDAQSPAPDND